MSHSKVHGSAASHPVSARFKRFQWPEKALIRSRLQAILVWLIPVLSYYLFETLTHNPFEIPVRFQILGFLFSLACGLLLFFLIGRARIALMITVFLHALLSSVNYFVLSCRESPILPWDIASLKTAVSVAGQYTFQITLRFVLCLAGFLLLLFLSFLFGKQRCRTGKARIGGGVACAAFLTAFVLCMQNASITEALDVYEMPFTQWYTYRQNGFMISFLVNTKYLKVEKPDGYTKTGAEKLLTENADPAISAEEEKKPNVIVIMNEAFSDLSKVGSFTTSEDPLAYWHSMEGAENTISGTVHVSVLGGNTANTEFEFLTGNSMAYLPAGSIPYQQFIKRPIDALPWLMKEQGYTTLALHPYNASGWRRDQVYPMLGFDRSMFSGDFTHKLRLRTYITDRSLYEQIEEEYETRTDDSPLFCFAVTMQNHGGYSKEWSGFSRDVTVTGMDELDLPRANAYFSLMKKSDEAFQGLIEYFKNVSEPTIILMFGDHQPNLETKFFERLYGKSYDSLTSEELALRYQTPFLLWANYDIEEETGVESSSNYLSGLLMKTAGLAESDYQNFLDQMQAEIPVITANFCYTADGAFHDSDSFSALSEPYRKAFSAYQTVQYYSLFDSAFQAPE